jgi:hypothetical protein
MRMRTVVLVVAAAVAAVGRAKVLQYSLPEERPETAAADGEDQIGVLQVEGGKGVHLKCTEDLPRWEAQTQPRALQYLRGQLPKSVSRPEVWEAAPQLVGPIMMQLRS